MYNLGTANMSAAVLPGQVDTSALINRNRNYGAGAIEAADERLKEELASRRRSQAQGYGHNLTPPERKVQGDIEQNKRDVAQARRRRQELEDELQRAKEDENNAILRQTMLGKRLQNLRQLKKDSIAKDRRRQAALLQKTTGHTGAKPIGICKKVQPPTVMKRMDAKSVGTSKNRVQKREQR